MGADMHNFEDDDITACEAFDLMCSAGQYDPDGARRELGEKRRELEEDLERKRILYERIEACQGEMRMDECAKKFDVPVSTVRSIWYMYAPPKQAGNKRKRKPAPNSDRALWMAKLAVEREAAIQDSLYMRFDQWWIKHNCGSGNIWRECRREMRARIKGQKKKPEPN